MKRICYIGQWDFTWKNAGVFRAINCAKTIEYGNFFKVDFVGISDENHLVEDGFDIYNIPKEKNIFSKIYNKFFSGLKIVSLLEKLKKYDIIIYYGESARMIIPLIRYCHKNNVKLIIDIVEWYDYSHLSFGRYGPVAWDVHYGITKLIPKCDGVIAISTYLEQYYQKLNCKTIRFPIVVDFDSKNPVRLSNTPFDSKYLNLIYAGTPGKKDLIANVITAVDRLSSEGEKIRFYILGVQKGRLKKLYSCNFSDNIICLGYLPNHDDVLKYISSADFTIFVKSQKRYAQAQFPTKLVESMYNMTPVIANLTGDIGLYLKDGYNGYVVNGYSTDAVYAKLKEILPIFRLRHLQMRKNSYNTIKQNLDYKLFCNNINSFLTQILKN